MTDDHSFRVASGGLDADAIEALYRRHATSVWRYAIARCRNADEAADIVAAVFLAALESAHRFDPRKGSAVAWLIGIAHHELSSRRRRNVREARGLAALRGRDLLSDDDRQIIDDQIDASRLARQLAGPITDLPRSERELLMLVGVDGLTAREAARVIGIAPAAARMRLSRARRKLARAAALEPVTPAVITPGSAKR